MDNHLLEDIINHKLIVVVLKRRRKTVTSFVLWYHVTLHCDPAFREIQKLLLVPKLKDLQGFEESLWKLPFVSVRFMVGLCDVMTAFLTCLNSTQSDHSVSEKNT